MAEVECQVRYRGGRLLLIETADTPEYAPARRLYESAGYHLEAHIPNFYGPENGFFIFAKELAPALARQQISEQQVLEEIACSWIPVMV